MHIDFHLPRWRSRQRVSLIISRLWVRSSLGAYFLLDDTLVGDAVSLVGNCFSNSNVTESHFWHRDRRWCLVLHLWLNWFMYCSLLSNKTCVTCLIISSLCLPLTAGHVSCLSFRLSSIIRIEFHADNYIIFEKIISVARFSNRLSSASRWSRQCVSLIISRSWVVLNETD